ncbi:hypothetical protein O6P43_030222 [Quillaja saponaria]|uniref:Uncharacterized protein n=1 Tax=Quillaja saponaria TaxID=32244 RepID=A0AAD7L1Q4_QUISA|nr:hypothetical protein O6P43_030222 [Quillaja saponaria]
MKNQNEDRDDKKKRRKSKNMGKKSQVFTANEQLERHYKDAGTKNVVTVNEAVKLDTEAEMNCQMKCRESLSGESGIEGILKLEYILLQNAYQSCGGDSRMKNSKPNDDQRKLKRDTKALSPHFQRLIT